MRVSSTQMIGRYQKQLNDSYEDQTKMMLKKLTVLHKNVLKK